MTEEELSKLDPEVSSPECASQFIVQAFESRFPELLNNDSRYLLFSFIVTSILQLTDEQKTENNRLQEELTQEIMRLRQALARIRNSSLQHEEPVSREIARAALEEKL